MKSSVSLARSSSPNTYSLFATFPQTGRIPPEDTPTSLQGQDFHMNGLCARSSSARRRKHISSQAKRRREGEKDTMNPRRGDQENILQGIKAPRAQSSSRYVYRREKSVLTSLEIIGRTLLKAAELGLLPVCRVSTRPVLWELTLIFPAVCFSRVRRPLCLSAMLRLQSMDFFSLLNTWEELNTQLCDLISNFSE